MLIRIFWLALTALALSSCGMRNDLTFQGYVEGEYSYISSAVSGTLLELPVHRGQEVTKGQLLFALDAEPEISQAKIAKQNLANAEQILKDLQKGQRSTIIQAITAQRAQAAANLDLATKNLHRYQALYTTRTIDKATLDQATSTYKAAFEKLKEIDANLAEAEKGARENLVAAQQANVDANKAAIQQAEWALKQKVVYAPYAALLFDTLHKEGEFIPAGTPVVIMLPRETLKIIFFVPQKILSKMTLGKKIQFTCDNCPQKYEATINYISPAAEYTPPVIFSKETRDKLVFRIEAKIEPPAIYKINAGQPVDIYSPHK